MPGNGASAGGQPRRDRVPDPRRQQVLRAGGSSVSLPSAPSSQPALSGTSNARPSPTAFTSSRSAPLRASFARPWCRTSPASSPVSAAKPTITWPGSRMAVSSTRMSGLRVSTSGSGSADPFLILWRGERGGAEVGHRGGHHDGVGSLRRGQHRLAQLTADPARTTCTAAGSPSSALRGDERHRGAALAATSGERVALPARRAVAEEADRVERLAGAAGGDHHVPAGEVAGHARAAAQQPAADSKISAGSGSRPGPVSPPVSRPDRGLDDDRPAAAQRRHVVPRGRVLPHLGVHRGREETGQRAVSRVVVSRSSARPARRWPAGPPSPGRRPRGRPAWPSGRAGPRGRRPRPRWHGLAGQRLPVAAPTKRSADAVGTTRTS